METVIESIEAGLGEELQAVATELAPIEEVEADRTEAAVGIDEPPPLKRSRVDEDPDRSGAASHPFRFQDVTLRAGNVVLDLRRSTEGRPRSSLSRSRPKRVVSAANELATGAVVPPWLAPSLPSSREFCTSDGQGQRRQHRSVPSRSALAGRSFS